MNKYLYFTGLTIMLVLITIQIAYPDLTRNKIGQECKLCVNQNNDQYKCDCENKYERENMAAFVSLWTLGALIFVLSYIEK